MGSIIFCISTIFYIIVWASQFKNNKFGLMTFGFFGVVFPCAMYLLRWSRFITEGPCGLLYYVVVVFELCMIFYSLICKPKIKKISGVQYFIKNERYLGLANCFLLCLIMVENYLLSGQLFPAIKGIDIHAGAFPIIAFITNSIYSFMFCDLFAFLLTRKKKYLVYYVAIILILFVGKGARMQVLISLVSTVSFLLFYVFNSQSIRKSLNRLKEKYWKRKVVRILIISCVALVFAMSIYTNYRMNQFGKYAMTYATEIGYTGPETGTVLDTIIATYYGYFPLSFNNLNVKLKYMTINTNYIGLYTFKSVYYGIFQLDNILGLDPYLPERTYAYHTTSAATVPTAFVDYYFDFGYLFFIPIIIHIFICEHYRRKMNRYHDVFSTGMYFLFVPITLFLSFQNVVYSSFMIWQIVVLYAFSKLFFRKVIEYDEKNL